MGDPNDPLRFTNSCVPIRFQDCNVGQKLINPCSCSSYFECQPNSKVLLRGCATGTFWNHDLRNCVSKDDAIRIGICNPDKAWSRCSKDVSGADLRLIGNKCGENYTVTQRPHVDTRVDPWLIIGVTVASVLLLIIIVGLVYMFYKRRKQGIKRRKSTHSSPADNMSYFAEARQESIYAKISDNRMREPVYSSAASERPVLPIRPPSQRSTNSNISVDLSTQTKSRMSDKDHSKPSTLNTSANGIVILNNNSKDEDYTEISLDFQTDTLKSDDLSSSPYDRSWLRV